MLEIHPIGKSSKGRVKLTLMPIACHFSRATGTSSKTIPFNSLFWNPVLHIWPWIFSNVSQIVRISPRDNIYIVSFMLLTCNCFKAVIFLSAFIIAAALETKAATTTSFPASSEGMYTEPTIPCCKSFSTCKKNTETLKTSLSLFE